MCLCKRQTSGITTFGVRFRIPRRCCYKQRETILTQGNSGSQDRVPGQKPAINAITIKSCSHEDLSLFRSFGCHVNERPHRMHASSYVDELCRCPCDAKHPDAKLHTACRASLWPTHAAGPMH